MQTKSSRFNAAIFWIFSVPFLGVSCSQTKTPVVGNAARCTPNPDQRKQTSLANGTVTTGYPEVVLITIGGGTGLCSGTVIGANVILTASHCLRTVNPSDFKIYFGREFADSKLGGKSSPFEVSNVVGRVYNSAPVTDEFIKRDLALLITKNSLPVRPRKLSKNFPNRGAYVTSIGYGLNAPRGTLDYLPREGKMFVTMSRPEMNSFITDSAGSEAYNLQGDSGGPKLLNGELVGVASAIRPAAGTGRVLGQNVSVISAFAQSIFAEATALGAKIGEDGSVSTTTPDSPLPAENSNGPTTGGATQPNPSTADGSTSQNCK
ncbi:MAG: trypsin-like serine protease [Proteobacteria bacterium]|nr:trypsin-like serine protease [Pseudomonadota bacterium]